MTHTKRSKMSDCVNGFFFFSIGNGVVIKVHGIVIFQNRFYRFRSNLNRMWILMTTVNNNNIYFGSGKIAKNKNQP